VIQEHGKVIFRKDGRSFSAHPVLQKDKEKIKGKKNPLL
jgi:hypothetical protein